jgi:hypothetical protein
VVLHRGRAAQHEPVPAALDHEQRVPDARRHAHALRDQRLAGAREAVTDPVVERADVDAQVVAHGCARPVGSVTARLLVAPAARPAPSCAHHATWVILRL